MELYFFELINSDLFPKKEYKSNNIIESSELFIKSLYNNYRSSYKTIHLELVHFRQIIYGLASTKKNTAELFDGIKSFLSKNYLRHEINEFIEQLKSEKQIVDILEKKYKGLNSLYVKISDWQKIMYSNFDFINSFGALPLIKNEQQKITDLSPASIKKKLDYFYYGPEKIKEEISRIFYEHNFRINSLKVLPKRNVFIVGPSGSGKTYLIKKMAEFFDQPFVSFDVTKMSRTGYVGDKVEDILSLLYNKAGSLEKMKNGIVFFDEVDKLAANLQYGSAELSTTGVQLDLLKFIEGDNYKFNSMGHRDYSSKGLALDFDSSNLLIICGGAFEGIDKIIEKRKKKNKFGFIGVDNNESFNSDSISTEDFIEYGLIKEFAARFQIVITLPVRSMDDLYDILVCSEDSILNNYKEYFEIHECALIFDEDALREIAKYAFEQKTGARGLVRILEKVLPMYSVANKEMTEFRLTKNIVNEKLNTNS